MEKTIDRSIQRQAARLVLLDRDRRALLLRHGSPQGEEYWALPGGGLEDGEAFEQAAKREAWEELGLEVHSLRFLWERTTDFVFGEVLIHQKEHIFLVEADQPNVSSDVQEVHKREQILAMRWWSIEELEAAKEPVFPEDLASRLKTSLRA